MCAEFGAYARTEQPVIVDDHHPHGVGSGHDAGHRGCHLELDLGAEAGRAANGGLATVPLHAADNRLLHAKPIARHRGRVESPAAIANEHRRLCGVEFRIDRDRGSAGVLGGVDHRLARSLKHGEQPFVQLSLADDNRLDRDPVRILDVRHRLFERATEILRVVGRGSVQPAAQLALLTTHQPLHLTRVVDVPLDQRQRVQHRVVQVRGKFSAFLLADSGSAFGRQLAQRAEPPRPGDDRNARDDDDGRQQAVAHLVELSLVNKESCGTSDHECRTAERRDAVPTGPTRPAAALRQLARCASSA